MGGHIGIAVDISGLHAAIFYLININLFIFVHT
jgi:hypothetical protein